MNDFDVGGLSAGLQTWSGNLKGLLFDVGGKMGDIDVGSKQKPREANVCISATGSSKTAKQN